VDCLTKTTEKSELQDFISKAINLRPNFTARGLYRIYTRLETLENSQYDDLETQDLVESVCHGLESSRGSWQSGWHVEHLGFDYGLVIKDGTKFKVESRRIKSMRDGEAIAPGSECLVSIPNVALGISPGYVFFFSENYPQDIYMRLYINSAIPANSELSNALKSSLDEFRLSYAFKIFTGFNRFSRADNTIVYLTRDATKVIRHLLQDLHYRLAGLCALETPFFTLRMSQGVSIARNPDGGESYGKYICSLLVDAFTENMHLNSSELIPVLSAHLARRGLDWRKVWALGDNDFVNLFDGIGGVTYIPSPSGIGR